MRGKFFFINLLGVIYKKVFGMNKYLRWKGVNIGDNNCIYSDIATTESYLIYIGNNNTISTKVVFITHDNAISKADPSKTDVFGEIVIGDNCFIGEGSTILPGISIADRTIVAAGSVVAKSVKESGMIIGGNPAKIIGTIEDYKHRMTKHAININGLSTLEKKKAIQASCKIIR